MADDGWVTPQPVILPDGTCVRLFKDGQALRAAYDAIAAARWRVCLEVYIFRSDPTGRAFAKLLCQRAKEGINVYVIYDSFGCLGTDKAMFAQMKNAGVRLREFHPLWPMRVTHSYRPFNRDHRKLLAIDDDIGGLGGLNIGGEYAGKWIVPDDPDACEPWRDVGIGLKGPSGRAFSIAFEKTWKYCTHGGRLHSTELLADPVPNGSDGAALMAGAPSPRYSLLTDQICEDVRQAQRTIRLTVAYFAPKDDLINELCRAARRGVRVQLMLPEHTDNSLLRKAAQSFYETLLVAGVEIYERQSVMLHAKTTVIDDCLSLVGSTNLDFRSIEYNLELASIIRSEAFAQQMARMFENDIQFSKQVLLDAWRHRPWRDRFGQWAVSRARYLL